MLKFGWREEREMAARAPIIYAVDHVSIGVKKRQMKTCNSTNVNKNTHVPIGACAQAQPHVLSEVELVV